MARRLLTVLGVFVGLIVAALVAGAAYAALKAPLSTAPNSNLNPENCSPGPCASLNGYTLWGSKVRVQNDIVHMTVKFQNSSAATHASPDDLHLIDICFRVANSTPPFILHWTPDIGAFCCERDLTIWPT